MSNNLHCGLSVISLLVWEDEHWTVIKVKDLKKRNEIFTQFLLLSLVKKICLRSIS